MEEQRNTQETRIKQVRQMADAVFRVPPPVLDVSTLSADAVAGAIDQFVDETAAGLAKQCEDANSAFSAASRNGPYFKSVLAAEAARTDFSNSVTTRLTEFLAGIRAECARAHANRVAAEARARRAELEAAGRAAASAQTHGQPGPQSAASGLAQPSPPPMQHAAVASNSGAGPMPPAGPAQTPSPWAAPSAFEFATAHAHAPAAASPSPGQFPAHSGVPAHAQADAAAAAPAPYAPASMSAPAWQPHPNHPSGAAQRASGSPSRGFANINMVAEYTSRSNSAQLQLQHAPMGGGGQPQLHSHFSAPRVHGIHESLLRSMDAYVQPQPILPPPQTLMEVLSKWMMKEGIDLDLLRAMDTSGFDAYSPLSDAGKQRLQHVQGELLKRRGQALLESTERQQREEQNQRCAQQLQQLHFQQQQHQHQQQQHYHHALQRQHQLLHQLPQQQRFTQLSQQQLQMPVYQQQPAPSLPQHLLQPNFFSPSFPSFTSNGHFSDPHSHSS